MNTAVKQMKSNNKSLIVFQDKKIRRVWYNEEWHYSVSDIIAVLTDSKDELAYWRKLKQREPQLVTICHGLKLPAKDGKLRYADCVNTKNAFRLIQSIPSKKAEPFKQWLAQVGKERIELRFIILDSFQKGMSLKILLKEQRNLF